LNARRQIGRNFDDQDACAPIKRAAKLAFNQSTDPGSALRSRHHRVLRRHRLIAS
jgi:hypothetical protein